MELLMSNVKRITVSAQAIACPECGSAPVAEILYGLQDSMDRGLLESGAVVFGGCVIAGDDPAWRCTRCRLNFFRPVEPERTEVVIA